MPLKPDLDPVKAKNVAMVFLAYLALLTLAVVGSIVWGVV